MSDFGANIFGPDDPPVPPRRPPKEPAAPPPPPARPQVAPPPPPPPAAPRHERDERPQRDHASDRAPRAVPADDERGGRERPPRHADARRSERPPEPRREHRDDRRPDRPHHDGPRHDGPRGERAPQDRPRHERPPQTPPRPEAPGTGTAPGRVALLVDLAALRDEARTQGAELSQHKLRNGIANHRPVARAVGFAPVGVPAPSGFEAVAADASFLGGVQFAALAFELLAAAGQLVLAPATPANLQLAQALRRAGHDVELAGLTTAAAGDLPVRRLGRDCLFVP